MSRPIKFRAWDGKQMHRADFSEISDGYKASDFRIAVQEAERIEIMQFTGLLDKNGKEIWEGDVVVDNSCGGGGRRGVVNFDEESAQFVYGEGWESGRLHCDMEVLGNLYENPELIRK